MLATLTNLRSLPHHLNTKLDHSDVHARAHMHIPLLGRSHSHGSTHQKLARALERTYVHAGSIDWPQPRWHHCFSRPF